MADHTAIDKPPEAPKNHRDHTEGSVIRSILSMGLPSMIGFGLGNIYGLIDTLWISRLSAEAVAALTFAGSIFFVIGAANHIVGVGSVAIISRRYGEQNHPETEMAIKETILLKWISAMLIGVLGYFTVPFILKLLNATGESYELAIIYSRIIFIGLGFNFATYTIFTALRGISHPMQAMWIMIFFTVLNIVLDPIFIFGWWFVPPLGVAGAAWASVISYVVAFITGLIYFRIGKTNIRLTMKNSREYRWQTMWQILKIGTPAAIGQISFAFARTIIVSMIAIFGTGVVAAYGVSLYISAFGIMLLVGIGLGLSALIGQNVGASKLDRAQKTATQAIQLSIGIMLLFSVISVAFAPMIMRIFFDDPDIISYGVEIMRILAIGLPFVGVRLTIENIYGGVGETRPGMVVNILHSWVLQIPVIFIFTRHFGFDQTSVWWVMSLSAVAATAGFYWYYRRGSWLTVKV